MNGAFDAINAASQEIAKLRAFLKRKKMAQVRSHEERSLIKATSLAWFNNHRKVVLSFLDEVEISEVDRLYKQTLLACDRSIARNVYDRNIKNILQELSNIKGRVLDTPKQRAVQTEDEPPDFSSLVSDAKMRVVLNNRWEECCICISAKAALAATVMMGGLVEALLLARVNKENNKQRIYCSKSAPTDKHGKVLELKQWTLRNYIDVAHELGWITQSARDIGGVLRDYRNYVHPYKQLAHNVELLTEDAVLFWEITKSMSRQLLHTK